MLGRILFLQLKWWSMKFYGNSSNCIFVSLPGRDNASIFMELCSPLGIWKKKKSQGTVFLSSTWNIFVIFFLAKSATVIIYYKIQLLTKFWIFNNPKILYNRGKLQRLKQSMRCLYINDLNKIKWSFKENVKTFSL